MAARRSPAVEAGRDVYMPMLVVVIYGVGRLALRLLAKERKQAAGINIGHQLHVRFWEKQTFAPTAGIGWV